MAASVQTVRAPNKNATVSKLKVKKGQNVQKGAVLCLLKSGLKEIQKLRATFVGTVIDVFASEGQELQPGEAILSLESCTHQTVMKDMCADCGANLRRENSTAGDRKEEVSASVAMVHSIPELIISEQQAMELGKEDEERLLKTRKLVLLVDLDQTLIHTTNDNIPANLKDVHHYQMWHGSELLWYHTRLRPGTKQFLKNISELFELHICTFGVRMYAHTIAGILDPEGKFFSHRILSRDECFNANSKGANLKALFPCGDSMVCIIDDREDVWNFSPNLIHVKPYRFFQGTADINAPPGLTKMEHDDEPVVHRERRVSQSEIDHPETKKGSHGNKSPDHKANGIADDSGQEKTADLKDVSTTNNTGESDNVSPEDKAGPGPMDVDVVVDLGTGDCSRENKSDRADGSDRLATKTPNVVEGMDVDRVVDSESSGKDASVKDKDCAASDIVSAAIDKDDTVSDNNKLSAADDSARTGDKSSEIKCPASTSETEASKTASGKDLKDDGKSCSVSKGGGSTEEGESKEGKEGEKESREEESKEESQEEGELKEEGKEEECQEEGELKEEGQEEGELKEESQEEGELKKEGREEGELKEESQEGELKKEGREEGELKKEGREEGEWLEWDDEDDYLFYLEDTLKKIHRTFYKMHDELKAKQEAAQEKPNLKNIIPYMKKKVLKGVNIVFSGIIPTNIRPEKSRAYNVALALGANVQNDFISPKKDPKNGTTHVVAAKFGTNKVRGAQKCPGVHILTLDWLWCCSERWERVEEMLFKLTKDSKARSSSTSPVMPEMDPTAAANQSTGGQLKRKSDDTDDASDSPREEKRTRREDTGKTGGEVVTSGKASSVAAKRKERFSLSYNPLLSFSDDDIACMDKEVEDIMDEEADSSSEDEEERSDRLRHQVLHSDHHEHHESSSEDSMSGDRPRGWGLKKKLSPKQGSDSEDKASITQEDVVECESETELEKFEKTLEAFAPDSDSEDYQDSVGSVDEEIAEAVEREFLS